MSCDSSQVILKELRDDNGLGFLTGCVEARLYIYSDKNSGWNTVFTMG